MSVSQRLLSLAGRAGSVSPLGAFSSGAISQRHASTTPPAPGTGMIEIREYTLHPSGAAAFMLLTKECAHLRKELMPILGMFTCDMGGALNKVVHMYHWKDFDDRDERREAASRNKWWIKYLGESRVHVQSTESSIFKESWAVYKALGLTGAANYVSPPATSATSAGVSLGRAMYEMRTTQLLPGYDAVPKVMAAFAAGLPPKVAADSSGQLVLCAHSDVGTLNKVVELWRYPSSQACINARQASRGVPEWRTAIGTITPGVQSFNSTFLRPTIIAQWQ